MASHRHLTQQRGGHHIASVPQVSPEDFRRATEVTYHAAVWGTMVALRHMSARGRGTIVQIGSALACRSIPLQTPYCGAKSALRGFTDSRRTELLRQHSGVRLTIVHLSAFNTPQLHWGRTGLDGWQRHWERSSRRGIATIWHAPVAHRGTHGRFDSSAKRWSLQFALNKHRARLGPVALVADMVAAFFLGGA